MHGRVYFRNVNHMCRPQGTGKGENSPFKQIARPVGLK